MNNNNLDLKLIISSSSKSYPSYIKVSYMKFIFQFQSILVDFRKGCNSLDLLLLFYILYIFNVLNFIHLPVCKKN